MTLGSNLKRLRPKARGITGSLHTHTDTKRKAGGKEILMQRNKPSASTETRLPLCEVSPAWLRPGGGAQRGQTCKGIYGEDLSLAPAGKQLIFGSQTSTSWNCSQAMIATPLRCHCACATNSLCSHWPDLRAGLAFLGTPLALTLSSPGVSLRGI